MRAPTARAGAAGARKRKERKAEKPNPTQTPRKARAQTTTRKLYKMLNFIGRKNFARTYSAAHLLAQKFSAPLIAGARQRTGASKCSRNYIKFGFYTNFRETPARAEARRCFSRSPALPFEGRGGEPCPAGQGRECTLTTRSPSRAMRRARHATRGGLARGGARCAHPARGSERM